MGGGRGQRFSGEAGEGGSGGDAQRRPMKKLWDRGVRRRHINSRVRLLVRDLAPDLRLEDLFGVVLRLLVCRRLEGWEQRLQGALGVREGAQVVLAPAA